MNPRLQTDVQTNLALTPQTPPLKTTGTNISLHSRSLDPPKRHSLSVSEGVHRGERDVESGAGMVDGQDVDAASVVGEGPAGAAGGGIPARDGHGGPDVREPRDLALRRPPVPRYQPVGAIRARHRCQASAGVVVALVVGHWDLDVCQFWGQV